ncbi:MAG TPA: class E sortase [Pseudonocardia sp.]|nr:class E sortase [Pseudonocardia sp.]
MVGAAVTGLLAGSALLPGAEEPAPRIPASLAERSAVEPPTWDQVQAIRDDLAAAAAAADAEYPIDPEVLAAIPTAPGEYTPLGRIRIDAVGLDAEYAAGVHPPVLERGPGHWPGTAIPGEQGNAVVSGHRTTYSRPFHDLDLLEERDAITVQTDGRPPVTFRVTETAVVTEAEYAEFVLQAPADPTVRQLTLFACEPKGDRTHRIVVRALVTEGGA